MKVIAIQGSPSAPSRSSALLAQAQALLAPHAASVDVITVRDLPALALVQAQFGDPAIVAAARRVADADVVLVATPIYKAAYSGVLKAFLDLLPQDGLHGKTVLPLATGGSPAHLLAVDYALKPVLSALGARDILDGVFATDEQVPKRDGGGYDVTEAIAQRLERALRGVIAQAQAQAQAERAALDVTPAAWAGEPLRFAV